MDTSQVLASDRSGFILTLLLIDSKCLDGFTSPSVSSPLCSMGFSGNQMG